MHSNMGRSEMRNRRNCHWAQAGTLSQSIALAAGLLLAGNALARDATPQEVEVIRDAMSMRLKDSSSALFRQVRFASDGSTICGQVNAKNAFGAYAGYGRFFAMWIPAVDGEKAQAIVIGIDGPGETSVGRLCAEHGL